mmetsp:Transcript_3510/g.6472  ORF Transcript_3510/g.6472 Transcript_3510/m.6472 type:complete len:217 (-) Transcript_3510:148-798(-)
MRSLLILALLSSASAFVVPKFYSQLLIKTQAERTFTPSTAKGGCDIEPSKTAIICIEFQNEFATEGGKLHDSVKGVMESTNMIDNTVDICGAARQAGVKIFHAPIMFAEDHSDNPNKGLGILGGCADGGLFTTGTWNADYCEPMIPKDGDDEVGHEDGCWYSLSALGGLPRRCLSTLHAGSGTNATTAGRKPSPWWYRYGCDGAGGLRSWPHIAVC